MPNQHMDSPEARIEELERENAKLREFATECATDKDDRISPGLKAKAVASLGVEPLGYEQIKKNPVLWD